MKFKQVMQEILQKWTRKDGAAPMTNKEKWLLLLLSGVLLAVIFFPMDKKNTAGESVFREAESTEKENSASPGREYGEDLYSYGEYLSDKLDGILSQIDGAGEVQSWVTLSGSSEDILYEEKDGEQKSLEEADSVGGSRKEEESKTKRTVLKDHDGNPYVVKILQPEVAGVLVVAEGAGNSTIKKNITEAVQVLFGIEAHRIKVVKKKAEE